MFLAIIRNHKKKKKKKTIYELTSLFKNKKKGYNI